jgi:predicted nuclease with TOPRIM domain
MKDPLDHQTLDLVDATKRGLSPAERQKRRRDKVRELKAREGLRTVLLNEDERRLVEQVREQKAAQATEGVQAITLTHTERCVLSLGLLAHEDLHHRPKDWEASKKPGFDALLRKLWPEGDNGRYLAEPERSTRRPSAFLRDQLDAARVENQRLKSALQEIAAEVGGGVVAPVPGPASEVAELRRRIASLEQENSLLEGERNGALGAVKVYVVRLQNAGLSTDYRRQSGE